MLVTIAEIDNLGESERERAREGEREREKERNFLYRVSLLKRMSYDGDR